MNRRITSPIRMVMRKNRSQKAASYAAISDHMLEESAVKKAVPIDPHASHFC
jgi:hypothetical protein